jgi:hypothetical protein
MRTYTYTAPGYTLVIDGARADVVLGGTTVAGLDVRSAVHQMNGGGETVCDAEPEAPRFVGAMDTEEGKRFVWQGRSVLWEEKLYTIDATPLRFVYRVRVKGRGRVDCVEYFSGDAGAPYFGSEYEFSSGFFPCPPQPWARGEDYTFKTSEDFHRDPILMVPPTFLYAFRTEGLARQLALGLAAAPGEHNFRSFDYRISRHEWWASRFTLTAAMDGHTAVDGEWTAPHVVGYGAEDEYDAVRQYAEYYFSEGGAQPPRRTVPPKFWHGPIACGWTQQHSENGFAERDQNGARETVYADFLDRLHRAGLYPRCLIIDDKWQSQYGTCTADPEKWPDLRRFADARHAEGIRTLLWFKAFDPEGIPEEALAVTENGQRWLDVSHPAYLALLREIIRRVLSADEGCYNCDGFKIDNVNAFPVGRGFCTYSGKYGVEYLYDFYRFFYETAKAVKPDALVNCSPCHPYFAACCDMVRLHDYNPNNRNCREDLARRAKICAAAMPGVLIDTDGTGINTNRDSLRWLLAQTGVGVPSLYCISPMSFGAALTEDEVRAAAQLWREYTLRVDRSYGE